MSGLDELFPDATSAPQAAVPVELAPSRRRLGLAALIAGLFANAVNIGAGAAVLALIVSFAGHLNDSTQLVGADWFIPFEIVALVGAVLSGLAGLVIGILAARRRAGRGAGIAGAVLGVIAVLADVLVIGALLVFGVATVS